MAAPLNLVEGALVLAHGSLFRVVEPTKNGFRVHCENGCWYGEVNAITNTLAIDGDDEENATLPFVIECRNQPPSNLTHYNDIIAWMKANKDVA